MFLSLRFAARRPAAQGRILLGLQRRHECLLHPVGDCFLGKIRQIFLDKKANKMVKLGIRSRAKKWRVERSLKISSQQLALSNQPPKRETYANLG